MEPTDFGQYLKSLRIKAGLSMGKLAREAMISQPYISQIESGDRGIPSPEIIKKLASALDADYIELMEAAGHLEGISDVKKEHLIANYDYQKSLGDMLEESLKVLSVDNEFLKIIKEDIKKLEELHEDAFEEGESLTPYKLREVVSNADWHQEWIWDIVKKLSIIAKKHDLDHEEISRKRIQEEQSRKELIDILTDQANVTYRGEQLSKLDRQRILDMLELLFPNR
ncbi:helix-turn-helix domain-containing protein [Paenibacillus taichungensis]|uniref:helix-turn-helix domain-containing protein n=1 Tax=Paenibacillus taichungensis TaxID=484184 RepID=UPI0038D1085A